MLFLRHLGRRRQAFLKTKKRRSIKANTSIYSLQFSSYFVSLSTSSPRHKGRQSWFMAESYLGWNWRDTTHFDSKDDYRTGCRNVSHSQQQQSYSGLRSPGQLNSTYFWNDSWVQAFHNENFDFKLTSDAKIQLVFTDREGSWLCLAWSRSTSHFHLRLVKI